jgi:predicted ATPase/transcriptional regulator with XRE-family HTH domain
MDAERFHDLPSFGDLLRRHRLAVGLTQEELAERASMSARGISDLERGARTRPQRETVLLLANALGLHGDKRADFLAAARHRPFARSVPEPISLVAVRHDAWPGARPPTPPNALIGREDEIAAIAAMLRDPGVRLLTLLGAGGIGKTRLAIAVAAAMRDEGDPSVAFVPLGAIFAPELLVPTIARTLDVSEVGGRTLEEQLVLALRRQPTLLVLDTFEQIVAAGPAVARLLAACPSLKILVTSRTPLRISGEHRFPVQPLAVPAARLAPGTDAIADAAAVRLFMTRARAVDPALALTTENAPDVADICRHLEGLPLALELAAARVAHMPLTALMPRLDHRLSLLTGGARDAPHRQRTLRDTIAWSYVLLTPEEQTLIRRLGVFAGGFGLEAAEAVATHDPPIPGAAFDLLESLLDNTLLIRREHHGDELRLGMLDTIREFAVEQLAASGEEEAMRTAHAAYFRQLAEQAEPGLFGAQPEIWTARLSPDHGNIVAALGWHQQQDDATALGWLAATLREYWFWTGRWSEGRRWLDSVVGRVASMPDDVAGKVLWATGYLTQQMGETSAALPLLGRARELRRLVGDEQGEAHCVFTMGMAALDRGHYADAESLLVESRDLWLDIDDDISVAYAEFCLANACLGQGNLEQADVWGEAAYERAVGLRSAHAARHSAFVLVDVALVRQDVAKAAARYRTALLVPVTVGEHLSADLADSAVLAGGTAPLVSAAVMADACGDSVQAARLFGAADRRREEMGAETTHPFTLFQGTMRATRSALGEESFAAAWAVGRTLEPEAVRAEIEAVLETATLTSHSPSPDARKGEGRDASKSPVLG